jgi:hypothetical protein
VSPLKIKIPSKNMRKKSINATTIHSDPACFGITLPSSGSVPSAFERCSIEEQSIEYSE